MLNLMV